MTIYLLMAPACIEVLLINVLVLDKYLLKFRRSKKDILLKVFFCYDMLFFDVFV